MTSPDVSDQRDVLADDLERVRHLLYADAELDDLDETAMLWLRLKQAADELDVLLRELSQDVARRLADLPFERYNPKDGYPLPNGEIVSHYQPSVRERWQGRALLRNLSTTMIEPDTGEVIPVVPFDVLTQIIPGTKSDELTSSKWSTTGLKNLDVNPDDYRSREWGEPRTQKGARR